MADAAKILLTEGDAPATPAAGTLIVYAKTDDKPYKKSSAGTEAELYSAGGTDVAIADGGTGASTASAAFTALKQAATTSATGVVELATSAESVAGSSTTLVNTPSGAAAQIAVSVNPRAMAQGVAMTYAASGSSGITVADNDNIDFGVGNFTLVWKGSLPGWAPAVQVLFLSKYQDVANRWAFILQTTGKFTFLYETPAGQVALNGALANTLLDGTFHEVTARYTRENAGAPGAFDILIDGLLFESIEVSAGTPVNLSNTGSLQVLGYTTIRYAGTTHHAYTFNRALTAAEELNRVRNGVAPQHRRASQTALTSGTLLAGQEYTIDTFVDGDNFSNIATVVSGTINTTGCIFVATGTTPTTWTNSSSLRATGATLILESEGIQPSPGQWLDSGANKLHAWQPATGSSITRYKKTFEIRGINTWAGTHEAQSITMLTDASRAMLPVDCYITDIIGVISGTTIEDIIIGDGSDTDRWVEITTGLAAGTVAFTLANRISDGTNYEMVVDPDSNATMTIEWVVRGFILE